MLRDLFVRNPRSDLVELITPRRSFKDVVLPQATRDQLYTALMQIDKHQLIFHQWGLGERHPHGTGLAFHFAGPPGTGNFADRMISTTGRPSPANLPVGRHPGPCGWLSAWNRTEGLSLGSPGTAARAGGAPAPFRCGTA